MAIMKMITIMHYHLFFKIILIFTFRLITLDSLFTDPNHTDMFIMNKDSKMKISKINNENIPLFYTVIHSRKIFFYTKGNYYGLGYDEDGVSLKLSPVNMGKIEFYTQAYNEDDVKKVKIVKWDDLIKKAREKAKEDDKESEKESDKKCEDDIKIKKSDSIRRQDLIRERDPIHSPDLIRERDFIHKLDSIHKLDPIRKLDPVRKNKPIRDDYNEISHFEHEFDHINPEYHRVDYTPDHHNPDHRNNHKDEIESDSEIVNSKSLNVKIDTVDSKKKTFFLKNENNLCVTYFKKSFVFAECKNKKRQVFRIVGMEEVVNKVKKDEEERRREDLMKEIEDERPDGLDDKLDDKMERPKKILDEDLEKKALKTPLLNEEVIEEIIESTEQPIQQNQSIQPIQKIQNVQPIQKVIPNQQINFYNFCKNLLNKNYGRIESLPLNCINILGIKRNGPSKLIKPKVIKKRIIKKTIPVKSPIQTDSNLIPGNNPIQTDKPLNVLERLQKALGQESFD